jgi:hypothetical protein
MRAVKRSLATTQWPVEIGASGGFLLTQDALSPWVAASVYVPVLSGVGVGVVGGVTGVAEAGVTVVEGVAGVGPVLETALGGLRARATLAPGVLVSGYDVEGGDNGVTVGPAVLVPLEVGLPLGGGVSFDLVITPGLSRAVIHFVGNETVYARDRVFLNVGAGITFGGPPE